MWPFGISHRKVNIIWGEEDFPQAVHDILTLRDDVQRDFSKTFRLLHFKLDFTLANVPHQAATIPRSLRRTRAARGWVLQQALFCCQFAASDGVWDGAEIFMLTWPW